MQNIHLAMRSLKLGIRINFKSHQDQAPYGGNNPLTIFQTCGQSVKEESSLCLAVRKQEKILEIRPTEN